MEDLSEIVAERAHQLVRSRQVQILSTTGTRAAIELLAARTEALEEAVRELTGLVHEMHESQPGNTAERTHA